MTSMGKVLQCDCGFEARGGHEDELVAEVRRHAWEAHGMALSPGLALLLVSRAELDDPSQNITSDREEDECSRRGDR